MEAAVELGLELGRVGGGQRVFRTPAQHPATSKNQGGGVLPVLGHNFPRLIWLYPN